MPLGWQSTDIGAPITAGTADYSPGSQSFYLDGAGADEYGANDQSHFVYQTLPATGPSSPGSGTRRTPRRGPRQA